MVVKQLLIRATTWRNLKGIMLKEVSIQRLHTTWFHLYGILEKISTDGHRLTYDGFDLWFFNFTTVWMQEEFSSNCTSILNFDLFPGDCYTVWYFLMMLDGGSSSQSSHEIRRVSKWYSTVWYLLNAFPLKIFQLPVGLLGPNPTLSRGASVVDGLGRGRT